MDIVTAFAKGMYDTWFLRWGLGFVISLGLGHMLTKRVLKWLRKGETAEQQGGVEGGLVGLIERSVFTSLVPFAFSAVGAAMMGWIAIKMAVNWKYAYLRAPSEEPMDSSIRGTEQETEERKKLREERQDWIEEEWIFERTSLLGNLMSMGFAMWGGLICRADTWSFI